MLTTFINSFRPHSTFIAFFEEDIVINIRMILYMTLHACRLYIIICMGDSDMEHKEEITIVVVIDNVFMEEVLAAKLIHDYIKINNQLIVQQQV